LIRGGLIGRRQVHAGDFLLPGVDGRERLIIDGPVVFQVIEYLPQEVAGTFKWIGERAVSQWHVFVQDALPAIAALD
jgi:hypothetical protein